MQLKIQASSAAAAAGPSVEPSQTDVDVKAILLHIRNLQQPADVSIIPTFVSNHSLFNLFDYICYSVE